MVNDTSLIETIKSRGHWVINIRPEQFEAERVPFGQLETVANNSVVRRRGWPVPMIDYRDPMLTGHNWIGQDIDAQVVDHYEAWRFYQSGQFRHIRSVSAEWREGKERTPAPAGFDAVLEVWEILYFITEVFELAGRLGVTVGADSVRVGIQLVLRPNTALVSGFDDLDRLSPRLIPHDLPEQTYTYRAHQLVTEYGPPAGKAASYYFERARWTPTAQALQVLQRRLYS